MKFVLSILICLFLNSTSSAQYLDQRRYITVNGSADMSITPDALTLNIILTENNEARIKMTDVEYLFFKTLKENGITKDRVALANSGYYWFSWWSHRNNQLTEKSYSITLTSDTDFMKLMKSLDIDGIKDIRISGKTHKKIHDYRIEVKKSAMLAAQKKANYMLESIKEKVGRVLSVDEINDRWQNHSMAISNISINTTNSQNEIDEVTKIKLRYEVKVKFEIL